MKEPCLTCPPRIKKKCNREERVCPEWEFWLFIKEDGRNAVQMRITQYYDDGETISEKTTVSAKMLLDLEKEMEE